MKNWEGTTKCNDEILCKIQRPWWKTSPTLRKNKGSCFRDDTTAAISIAIIPIAGLLRYKRNQSSHWNLK